MKHSNNYRNKGKRYFLPRHFLVIVPIIVAISAGYIQHIVVDSGLMNTNHPGINGALSSFVSMFTAVFFGVVLYFFLIVHYEHKNQQKK